MTDSLLIAVAALATGALLGALTVLLLRVAPGRGRAGAETELAELARRQGEAAVRLQAMGDMLAGRQAELARAVSERLDAVTQRLGQSMQASSQHTVDNLQKLNERLAVIDSAQKNM